MIGYLDDNDGDDDVTIYIYFLKVQLEFYATRIQNNRELITQSKIMARGTTDNK